MMADTSCALPCNVVRESSSRTYHLVQVSAGLALCHSDQSVNLATPCKTQTTDNPKPRQVRIFPEPHARGSRHLPQLQPEREQSGHGRNYIRGRGPQTMDISFPPRKKGRSAAADPPGRFQRQSCLRWDGGCCGWQFAKPITYLRSWCTTL